MIKQCSNGSPKFPQCSNVFLVVSKKFYNCLLRTLFDSWLTISMMQAFRPSQMHSATKGITTKSLLRTSARFSPWIATIHNPSTMKNSIVQKKVSFRTILNYAHDKQKRPMKCLDAFLTHHYNLHLIKLNKQVQCENYLQF
jgi:hypothetical protein